MATYYVSSVDGSNSDNGTTWALAVATLKYAVETLAATGGPHTILVDSAHTDALGADTTITAAQDLRIISVNRSGSDAPLAGALIGSQATNYSITLTGAFEVYVYGVEFQNGTNTTAAKVVNVNITDGGHFEFESCVFDINGTSEAYLLGHFGSSSTNNYTKFKSCTFDFGNSGHRLISQLGLMVFEGCSTSGTTPGHLFLSNAPGTVICEGCDFASASALLVVNNVGNGTAAYRFSNCLLGTTSILQAATSVLNKGQTTVELLNCSVGDEHWRFAHHDAFGSTVAQTTIYANTGAKYDGTNGVAWKIDTTANCSFYTPYVSPWFSQYAAAATVTPTVEIVRSGSATAYQDDEVWGEFSYQGTSGSTKATIVSDRTTIWPLSPANQAAGALGASDWTGENATSWFGKLSPGAITINEIGHLSARIVVGEPSITVYADPTIRT